MNEETGEIIPKKTQTQIHFSKSFGQYHVLHELAKQSGLEGRLRDAFGDDAALMLALAMVRVVDPTSMRNAHLALENEFNGQPWHPGIPGELADWAGKLDTCLEAVEENGKVAVRRKRNAISQLANRCGKMILLTSRDVQWKEALMTYRQRDEAEQDFGQLKGDIVTAN